MVILLILSFALIIRIISLNQSFWLDEAINVLAAKNYSFFGIITEYAKGDFHPPGYFIFIWGWLRLFGFSEIAARIPSIIFAIGSIYTTFLIGKKIYSKNLGYLAAFILAINPLHIYYSQEARMYSFTTFLVCINFYLFIKILKDEKVNPALYILSNFLVLMSDYLAYFIFPAQLIIILVQRHQVLKKWSVYFLISAAASLIWLPVFISQLSIGINTSSNIIVWKEVVGSSSLRALGLTFIKFMIGRISIFDKVTYAMVLIIPSLVFLILIARALKLLDKINRSLLLAWLLIPIVLAWLISFVIPIFSYFRVLFTLPSFILLIAFGILSFKNRWKYPLLFFVFFVEATAASIYLFNPSFQREDWRGMVNFLENQGRSKILFESSGVFSPFTYYSQNKLDTKGALKNFPAKSSEDLANLENYVKDSRSIYLVDYLVDIADPYRIVNKKLEKLGYKRDDVANFNGVGFLYHYQK